jgi:alkyl sulfatase BDS1-like metallo-beta-lactamase superfamily hydrolase
MHQKTARHMVLAALLASTPALIAAAPQTPDMKPKPASAATIAAQASMTAMLPAEDGRDADFSMRGYIATRTDPLIRASDGHAVWNLSSYDFVAGTAPGTVNPSLWRHIGLLRRHGLFKVTEGVWQVRGFDVSNMTVIKGSTGWILVDPLTNKETAAAALELVNQQLGARPVSAVIYSHSHADHFGGVRGVVSEADVAAGKVAIIAPAQFIEESASENIMAGGAMSRRAGYQFGTSLIPGAQGQMGSGIGTGVASGEITLITPTDTILKTGDTRTIDGVPLEFQMVSGSEAPSELNVYIVPARTFLSAEMSTCSLHNILTPRGAKVRDARAWAGYLDEAVQLYGGRSDAMISSHCWPRFGVAEVADSLAGQRDNYRYLHDQTVRLMNRGETAVEIAEEVKQPPAIAGRWYNHGYYGTYSHNSKAIYQFYLGWYDAVPANLNPLPPAPRAVHYVAAMGGTKKVIALARRAIAEGDYRWSSDLLNQLVFAEPGNAQARALLADSYEQQGYQTESGIWRNQFLSAARDLREGARQRPLGTQSADMIAAIPTQTLLDSISTRFDPAKLSGRHLAINLVLPDRKESASVEAGAATMIGRMKPLAGPNATITGPRRLLLGLVFLKLPLAQLEAAGLKVEGDRSAVETWANALDPLPGSFNIAEP